MTSLAHTSSTPTPVTPGRLRRVSSTVCLGLPALVVAAFGGQLLVTGWTDSRPGGMHHVHDLAWGSLEGILLLVPLLAVLRRAERRPAAFLQALAVVAALVLTMALTVQPDPFTLVLGGLVITGTALSPARTLLVRRGTTTSRPLLALSFVAAAPLVPYALTAAAAQRAGGSVQAALFGYTGATAWALAVIAVIAVAALRAPGWQLSAVSAAAAATVVGAASLLWPTNPSSLGTTGGLLALAWAGAVVTIAIRSRSSAR